MAKLVKLPNPPEFPEGEGHHKSYWALELSDADLRELAAGGFATIETVLPISAPNATIEIRKA